MEAGVSIISRALLLFFVLDPFGNIPVLLSMLKEVETKRMRAIIIREAWYGLLILLAFLFIGGRFLQLLHLEAGAVGIAGAIIFFVIGIRMIFPGEGSNLFGLSGEPLVVPIAIPMIAGPSALATLLVLSESGSSSILETLPALLLAWVLSSGILLFAPFLFRVLHEKGLQAMEKLMGMILLMMSVQMFIDGVRSVVV
ncbi:MarC family protein [Desulfopila sp. IMCC35008]|uniref:MarC family protein n=1 Tax=Desulfopila sp. IMCC35008 TaxID=2653858 RepID=UPI0013D61F75|nr:MarC family protein [Desulfopila sp. IMCC35008]